MNVFAKLTLRYDFYRPFKIYASWFLIENFEIVSAANSEENLHLYFFEAKLPKEFDALELVSKGFLDEITIQDYPLRVSLSICTLNVVVGPIKPLEKSFKEIGS
jgi:hypothetical protein